MADGRTVVWNPNTNIFFLQKNSLIFALDINISNVILFNQKSIKYKNRGIVLSY